MSATPLKRGDKVRLSDEPKEIEIESAGAAGFRAKGRLTMLLWTDRGTTWSSDVLDRQDAARSKFRETATGGEDSKQKGRTE